MSFQSLSHWIIAGDAGQAAEPGEAAEHHQPQQLLDKGPALLRRHFQHLKGLLTVTFFLITNKKNTMTARGGGMGGWGWMIRP